MFSRKFWADAAERAARTAAQVMLGFIVVGETGALGFNWQQSLSVTAMAVLASFLMSIAGNEFGERDTGSWLSHKGGA